MTNLEALERFEQAHGAKIERLYWIAGSFENSDFKDLMQELEDKELKRLFPEFAKDKYFKEYRKDKEEMQMLVDYRKFGFLAEIHVPEAYDFKFKEGTKKPWAWGVHGGCCKIKYVYSETIEGMMTEIEKASTECWNYDLKRALAKK